MTHYSREALEDDCIPKDDVSVESDDYLFLSCAATRKTVVRVLA